MANNEIKVVETVQHVEDVADSQLDNDTRNANSSPEKVRKDMAPTDVDYTMSIKTYVVLFFMGIIWGTCTLANVGPSSTYHHAIVDLGNESIQAWIPNAALFPLIGLQPIWVCYSHLRANNKAERQPGSIL